MIQLRQAQSGDVAIIIDLADALTREDAGQHAEAFNLDWVRQEDETVFARMIDDDDRIVCLAERDGKVVGYCSGVARERPPMRTVQVAELLALYVVPGHRNLGIGEQLVHSFLAWAREKGTNRASVSVFAANEGALRFYRRAGFNQSEVVLERSLEQYDGNA